MEAISALFTEFPPVHSKMPALVCTTGVAGTTEKNHEPPTRSHRTTGILLLCPHHDRALTPKFPLFPLHNPAASTIINQSITLPNPHLSHHHVPPK